MDPGQPLVNAIRTDSALIGGNSVHLSKEEQLIKEFNFFFFFEVQLKESDVVMNRWASLVWPLIGFTWHIFAVQHSRMGLKYLSLKDAERRVEQKFPQIVSVNVSCADARVFTNVLFFWFSI